VATDRANMQAGLVTWVSTLASNAYPTPLAPGVVQWFNRARPFISDSLGVGIYLRIQTMKSPGIDGKTYAAHGTGLIRPTYTSAMKMRLQIQALSYNETDDDSALNWLSNISDRVWFDDSRDRLRLDCSCSVISTGEITILESTIDDRAASIGTFDLVLHWRSAVLGLDVQTIDGVSGTSNLSGRSGTFKVP
jgi:hypothetical protein